MFYILALLSMFRSFNGSSRRVGSQHIPKLLTLQYTVFTKAYSMY